MVEYVIGKCRLDRWRNIGVKKIFTFKNDCRILKNVQSVRNHERIRKVYIPLLFHLMQTLKSKLSDSFFFLSTFRLGGKNHSNIDLFSFHSFLFYILNFYFFLSQHFFPAKKPPIFCNES